MDLYWFWEKIQYSTKNLRLKSQFETLLISKIIFMKYNGQNKAEFQKNYQRIVDIINKSQGDKSKEESLSKTQANRITDEWKAINRAMAAKEMGHENIFDIFFRRAYELGSVPKQEYREYQLSKLGI